MCGVLATLYAFTQEYVKSEQNFFEAISGIRRILGEDHDYYYLLCNALGILYQQWSKYDKAETVYVQLREIRKKKGDTISQKCAETSTQLGTI